MNIVHVTSEAVPFVKTGGLGDVVTPLATELAKRGHAVSVFLPAFRSIRAQWPRDVERIPVEVPVPSGTASAAIVRSDRSTAGCPFYFVDYPQYFDRDGLYVDASGKDFADNSDRFSFFCRAVLIAAEQLQLQPDVFHCHDWQASLLPVYLHHSERWKTIASSLTIHNLAFQGNFDFRYWPGVMLDGSLRGIEGLEYYGLFSHLKGGIIHADAVNTVSPNYAKEILTVDFGCGFDGLLRSRSDHLRGILNGIDIDVWNPRTDQHLEHTYDESNWQEGKRAAKAALVAEANLEEGNSRPLISMVGRLTMQKGFDLFCTTAEELIDRGANVIALATHGSPELEMPLWNLAQRFPMRAAIYFGFNEPLARRVYAGSDILAIPSRFEPCGLTQMIAMRYGTVPVARAVGGLKDTIVDTTPSSLKNGTANGFIFHNASAGALNVSLQRALYAYEKPEVWSRIIKAAFASDFSWTRSATEYESMYQSAIDNLRR